MDKIKIKNNPLKSYIEASVFGTDTESFINSMIIKGVKIWNVENRDGMIFLNCYPHNYMKIASSARSAGLSTKVTGRYGTYFKLRKYKKRYGAFLGVLGFAFIIVFMGNFVWDIKITGNETVTSNQIIEQLENNGIKIGVGINDYHAPSAELALKLALDKLAWVSIERNGSRVLVKLSERLDEEIKNIPVSEPCNVVASKTGRIISTEVYRGSLLLEKGSGVNKGDIIVSGVVEDGAGNNLLNHADAKIIAECDENTEFYMPYTVTENKKSGSIAKRNYIIFLGNIFPLFIKNANTENAYYTEEMKSPDLFGFKLPFRIKTCSYEYYDNINVTYSQTEALEKLNKQLEIYKINFFENGENEIVDFNVEYFPDETGVTAKVKVVYKTNIAEQKAIALG